MVLVDGIHNSLFNRNVWPGLGSRGSWTCEHGFGVRCSLTATGSFYILFFISVPLYDTLMSSEASRPPILICKSHFIASACTEEWHFYHFSHSVAASASFALAVTALSVANFLFYNWFIWHFVQYLLNAHFCLTFISRCTYSTGARLTRGSTWHSLEHLFALLNMHCSCIVLIWIA